ncbi:cytochrome c-type biogenesis protein CcmH [Novosphingobium chloroacetimidivorans]|uniref:Cytochrome c-type biogenesis protein CcmH n=1 Tax=Novosphingobium chloroacetimidivorans TaxID=1428314 RepID=A0A7W7NVQ9_9SPHN|nr:tetratricopeptide repeat protein [Novosphingobium chloroacetimidivorans]MBB4858561.1 cytochrome c-type biogenesis protein CcmH [Novosphingobium chloroacetimidivorans]
MTWIIALVLALAAFLLAVVVLRAPRRGWEAIAAALLLGVAGYAFQAKPVPAAPTAAREQVTGDPAALVKARARVTNSGIPPTDRWVVVADALARNGQFAAAAEMLRAATDEDPKNAEAWLAMGNALVAHADGQLTPAALTAFQRAAKAEPEHPGPPYFLGLALAQSGRFVEARELWRRLLDETPPDAPWHDDLQVKLRRLDMLMSAQQTGGEPR